MIATGVGIAMAGDPLLAYGVLGTLKPVHGVALHAVLVLPAFAWLASAMDRSERWRVWAVWAAIAGYTALVIAAAAISLA